MNLLQFLFNRFETIQGSLKYALCYLIFNTFLVLELQAFEMHLFLQVLFDHFHIA